MIYHTTSLTPTTLLDTAHGNDHHTIYPTDGWRVRSMLRDGADQANAVLRRKSHRNQCAAVHCMHDRHGAQRHMPSVQRQNRHEAGSIQGRGRQQQQHNTGPHDSHQTPCQHKHQASAGNRMPAGLRGHPDRRTHPEAATGQPQQRESSSTSQRGT